MADIFTLTALLTVKELNGKLKPVAEYFKYPQGIFYFNLYWYQQQPNDVMHVVEGVISGEGSWQINNSVLSVAGCRDSDLELALEYEQWQTYLQTAGNDYPAEGLVYAMAKKMGADIPV